MLDTLQKMSGIRHVTMKDSKTITKDLEKPIMAVEGKVSYSFNAKEVPVISYNDMAFLTMRNAIVFRAGDPPSLVADASRALEILGWKPEHSGVEEIIRDAWNWYRLDQA